MISYLFEYLSM